MFDPFFIDPERGFPDIGPVRVPSPLTSLLGRDQEVAEIVAMLRRGDVRLVTITGSGGVGKTRLSIDVARQLQDCFDGGQYYIAMDRVDGSDRAVPVLLDILRRHHAPDATTLSDLAEAIGDVRPLMILNAAERIVDARTDLIRMLEQIPSVTVLVTSRVPLRVRGEQEYPIGCLPLPDREMPLHELRKVPSVQLFLERAKSVRPTFDLNDHNRDDIIEVLHRLDGLPVAIELAALRSRLFPVSAIRERMDALLDFLSGGPHDLPYRLQSIRSVIQWGYDLLDPRDQMVFRTLSVFEAAFSFEGALNVLVDEEGQPMTTGEVMDSLTALVDHSFIMQVPVEGTEAGYRMSTTTREFGRELLVKLGEHAAARDREMAFYLDAFRRSEPAIYGPQQPELLARVDFFSRNLHTALHVARREKARVENALRVARYMSVYWLLRGNVHEGAELLQTFLDLSEDITSDERAVVYRQLGALYVEMHQIDKAHAHHARALEIYEQLGDEDGMAESWGNLGVVAMRMGDIDGARDFLNKAYEARQGGTDQAALAQVLGDMGDLAMHEGDMALAQQRYEEAYRIHLEMRNRLAVVCDCVNLLTGAILRDEPRPREDWYDLGVRFAEDISDQHGKAQLQLAHAMRQLRAGELAVAYALITETLEVIRRSGSERLMLETLPMLADVCVHLGDDRMAAQVIGAISRMSSAKDRFGWYKGKRRARKLERGVLGRLGEVEFTRFLMLGAHHSIEQTIGAVLEQTREALQNVATRDSEQQDPDPEEVVQLTGREREVLTLVAQGHSDKAIAEMLRISPRTAMTHVSNIMAKMKVHSRSAAAEYGIRMGLVPPPREGS